MSCLFPKNENLENKIIENKILENKVIELENQNHKLNALLIMKTNELSKFKRSPYYFLGHPMIDINQRTMI
jgi:hypothetical protein